MIHDWIKYEAYRVKLMQPIKSKYSSIDGDTFYDLFQEAYLEKYPVFESNFDSNKSKNELGYLYRLVRNKINDLLKKQKNVHALIEIHGDDDYADLESVADHTANTFAEFLFKVVTQRSGLKSADTENGIIVNKYKKNVTPLIKLEAWAQKQPITEEVLNYLAEKVTSDVESEQFYDWIEPTSIVRLKSWVGCS